MSTQSSETKDQTEFLSAGMEFGGSVIVQECLSVGKRTVLYKCYQAEFPERPLILAVVKSSVAKSNLDIARFRKGLAASFSVSHPNVVRTYECLTDNDMIGYTMDYAPNGSLDDMLNDQGQLSLEDVLRIGMQICSGLSAVHSAGIVHRDLRPKHILFGNEKHAMISGFGLALLGDGPRLTSHGEVVGTVGYASPEYLQHGKVDHRSDIYAIGLLLYEMITGQFPFNDANPVNAITMRMTRDPEPTSDIRPDCPQVLAALVQRAMDRDPEKRYQAVRELLEDLQAISKNQEPKNLYAQPTPAPKVQAPVETPETDSRSSEYTSIRSSQSHTKPTERMEGFSSRSSGVGIRSSGRHMSGPDGIMPPHAQNVKPTVLIPNLDEDFDSGINPRVIGFAICAALFGIFGAYILASGTSSSTTAPQVASSTASPTPSPALEANPNNHIIQTEPAHVGTTPAPEVATQPEATPAEPPAEKAAEKPVDLESDIAAVVGSRPATAPEQVVPANVAPIVPPPVAGGKTYTVVPGDSVSKIAIRYGISTEEIVRLNNISNKDLLISGQVIALPGAHSPK